MTSGQPAGGSSVGILAATVTVLGYSVFTVALRKGRDVGMLPTVALSGVLAALVSSVPINGFAMTGRDLAPEALEPLFDKAIEGFGELFRAASIKDIGAATIQSRAFAGLANGTVIFSMPGSPNACRTAWEDVIKPQLDARTRPCNLANVMPRFMES